MNSHVRVARLLLAQDARVPTFVTRRRSDAQGKNIISQID